MCSRQPSVAFGERPASGIVAAMTHSLFTPPSTGWCVRKDAGLLFWYCVFLFGRAAFRVSAMQ